MHIIQAFVLSIILSGFCFASRVPDSLLALLDQVGNVNHDRASNLTTIFLGTEERDTMIMQGEEPPNFELIDVPVSSKACFNTANWICRYKVLDGPQIGDRLRESEQDCAFSALLECPSQKKGSDRIRFRVKSVQCVKDAEELCSQGPDQPNKQSACTVYALRKCFRPLHQIFAQHCPQVQKYLDLVSHSAVEPRVFDFY